MFSKLIFSTFSICCLSFLFCCSSGQSTQEAQRTDEPSIISEDTDRSDRKMLLRDEGLSQLSYVDLGNPENSWNVIVPKGRDLQLIGDEKVMIGTGSGYAEYDIKTGKQSLVIDAFPGTISCRRLRNGNTLLMGINWQDSEGIVLIEVDKSGAIKRKTTYPDYGYARLIRQTNQSTYLISANDQLLEGDTLGNIVWKAQVIGRDQPHCWHPIRLKNGQTILSGGYTGNIQFFDVQGNLIKTIGGPESILPNFYSGLQLLENNNLVVTNWEGHGPGNGDKGIQVLEYNPDGTLAWSWKQDPKIFSSLQAIIVLDGLDLSKLHVEGEAGYLVAVN